mmetsp:Transcript_23602/g.57171  ORF Transcript_23602/g.57171 Transcript_23602/m.57171 type:complete len:111 (-) Transcript_23602:491-823(-)
MEVKDEVVQDAFTLALEEKSSSDGGFIGVVTSDCNGLRVGATGSMKFEGAASHVHAIKQRAATLVGSTENEPGDILVDIQMDSRNIIIFGKDSFTFGVVAKQGGKKTGEN